MSKRKREEAEAADVDRIGNRRALIQYLVYALDEVSACDADSAAYLRMAIAQLDEKHPRAIGGEILKHS